MYNFNIFNGIKKNELNIFAIRMFYKNMIEQNQRTTNIIKKSNQKFDGKY